MDARIRSGVGRVKCGFFLFGGFGDFTGVLGEMGVSTWYFDDECVVVCVVKAGKRMSYFGIRGSAEFSKFIFLGDFVFGHFPGNVLKQYAG
jgi:hypothetical protein